MLEDKGTVISSCKVGPKADKNMSSVITRTLIGSQVNVALSGELYTVVERTLIAILEGLVLAVMLMVDFRAPIPLYLRRVSWIK